MQQGGKQELGFPQGKPPLPACSHNWGQSDPVPSFPPDTFSLSILQLGKFHMGALCKLLFLSPLMTIVEDFLLLLVPLSKQHVVKPIWL